MAISSSIEAWHAYKTHHMDLMSLLSHWEKFPDTVQRPHPRVAVCTLAGDTHHWGLLLATIASQSLGLHLTCHPHLSSHDLLSVLTTDNPEHLIIACLLDTYKPILQQLLPLIAQKPSPPLVSLASSVLSTSWVQNNLHYPSPIAVYKSVWYAIGELID